MSPGSLLCSCSGPGLCSPMHCEQQRETGRVGVRLSQEESDLQGWHLEGLENFSSSKLLGFSAHVKARGLPSPAGLKLTAYSQRLALQAPHLSLGDCCCLSLWVHAAHHKPLQSLAMGSSTSRYPHIHSSLPYPGSYLSGLWACSSPGHLLTAAIIL